jgi:hypothetical protein
MMICISRLITPWERQEEAHALCFKRFTFDLVAMKSLRVHEFAYFVRIPVLFAAQESNTMLIWFHSKSRDSSSGSHFLSHSVDVEEMSQGICR